MRTLAARPSAARLRRVPLLLAVFDLPAWRQESPTEGFSFPIRVYQSVAASTPCVNSRRCGGADVGWHSLRLAHWGRRYDAPLMNSMPSWLAAPSSFKKPLRSGTSLGRPEDCRQRVEASLSAAVPLASPKERDVTTPSPLTEPIPFRQGTGPGLVVAGILLGARAPLDPSSPDGALSTGGIGVKAKTARMPRAPHWVWISDTRHEEVRRQAARGDDQAGGNREAPL
jgi:hypothetical protein